MRKRRLDLGPLEMEVLSIVDHAEGPVAVSFVGDELGRRGHELAYTTVMTVLTRLHQKKFLQRRKAGRQFLYFVGKSTMLERVTQSFFQRDKVRPILALLDSETEFSLEELRRLRSAVEQKLSEYYPHDKW